MIGFVIAGASSNVGKTTISSLLMYAFKQRGLTVQAFKCGPDYLDPTFHSHVTGRPSLNLDLHLMGEAAVKDAFYSHLQGVDIAIIEGVMGMYDGADHALDNGSSAHIARILGLPVVLIVDGSGVATSLAATVLGFQQFDSRCHLAGVIINGVGSDHHYKLLVDAITQYTQATCFGYLPKLAFVDMQSRHLGLKPSNEVADIDAQYARLLTAAKDSIDFTALSEKLCFKPAHSPAVKPVQKGHLRLAIAMDSAFYFYYHENLEMLAARGVELVPFSPLADTGLPANIDGIYLGGGYPELHAVALASNQTLKSAIYQAAHSGMPIYAECGGLMYLMRSLSDLEGNAYPMVGIFAGDAQMTDRLQHFGYVVVTLTQDTILGKAGTRLNGHEFHRSTIDTSAINCSYSVQKARGKRPPWQCGASFNNCLGAYAHLHFKQFPEALDHWVNQMNRRKQCQQNQL